MAYVECDIGQTREAGEKQSDKKCEECHYFERDITVNDPCGLCYESKDKYNWKKKGKKGVDDYEECGSRLEEVGRENGPTGTPYLS